MIATSPLVARLRYECTGRVWPILGRREIVSIDFDPLGELAPSEKISAWQVPCVEEEIEALEAGLRALCATRHQKRIVTHDRRCRSIARADIASIVRRAIDPAWRAVTLRSVSATTSDLCRWARQLYRDGCEDIEIAILAEEGLEELDRYLAEKRAS